MVLEHCIAALQDGFTDIKILSDSQTAVGILNLNWKSSNYIDTITDIKENIGTLMRYEMRTTLSWIPGHANIAGNEIADQLAKEAAKESSNAAMQCSNTMSIATSYASSMDPLCATRLLRLIPSLSPGYSTAPDAHGPGLP
jgi:hypothetical protein